MKTVPLTTTAVLALALSACSGGEPAPGAEAGSEVASAAPDGTAASEAAAHEPSPVPNAAARAGIPDVLRGRWGLVAADCTSTRGDAKGLLTVDADSLTFYESVARLDVAKSTGADNIRGTFAFSGEGQSWTLDVALSTPDGGRTLVRKDTGSDATPATLTYTKCP